MKKSAFTRREILELIASLLVVIFCTSLKLVFFPEIQISEMILIPVLLGLSVIGHELSHKLMARRYGVNATFKIFKRGIAIAILITTATFIISMRMNRDLVFVIIAPGAIITEKEFREKFKNLDNRKKEMYIKINGKIAAAGPLLNIIIALIFTLITYMNFYGVIALASLGRTFRVVASLNAFITFINLITLEPFDGYKIMNYSKFLGFVLSLTSMLLWLFS